MHFVPFAGLGITGATLSKYCISLIYNVLSYLYVIPSRLRLSVSIVLKGTPQLVSLLIYYIYIIDYQ